MTIELTEQQMGVVLSALAKLPLEVSYDTFQAIKAQVTVSKQTEVPKKEVKDED